MEHSSSQSFTNMMNSSSLPPSSLPPSDHQNPNILQNTQNPFSQQYPNIHPSHMNYTPPQYNPNPNFRPHYPQHANFYGGQGSYQQFPPMPSIHHGAGSGYHGNMGQYPPGPFGAGASSSPSSPVGCMPFLGSDVGSSRRDESSPIGVETPISPPYPTHFDPAVDNEEGSESSPDEIEKKGKSKNWSKHEDELLISAWLHNSCDPIDGNSKKAENYWKEVAAEFNKYATKEEQKTVMQCKNHWTKTTKKVTKFNGVYNAEKTMWPSGCDDHGFMEKVRAKYKSITKTKRPFAYEHWWKAVKVEAKWRRSYSAEEMNKRNKLNAAGAYSSPSQSTDQEGVLKRPIGRNKAKAQHKSTSKSTDSITSESVDQFNDIQLRKTIAAERIADAALVHAEATKVQAEATKVQAEADKERAETEKEKMKVDKLSTYLDLLHKDTSSYDDSQKSRHEQVVDFLAKELFG